MCGALRRRKKLTGGDSLGELTGTDPRLPGMERMMAILPAPATPSSDGAQDGRVAASTAYDAPLPSFEAPPPDTDLTVPRLPSTMPPPRGVSEPRLVTARAQSTAAPEVTGSSIWARAPMWLANAGEAVRGRLPLAVRDRLHAFPGAKVFALSAGVGLAFFGVFATTGALTYRALRAPELASATTPPAPAGETALPAVDAPAAMDTAAPSRAAQPVAPTADEPKVLLDLAQSLLAEHRDAEVPSLLGRLIVRRPELKDDDRLKRLLLAAAASEDRRASSEAHALLTGPMGETGAALVYELAVAADVREPVRLRAQTWLKSKDFERNAALPVYAAAKLRSAKTCEDKHALLDFAGAVGGKYVLTYLHELEGQTSCKPEDLVHCQPCMRNDSRLSDTIAKLERPSR